MKYQIFSDMTMEERRLIRNKLDEFSEQFTGPRNFSEVGLVLRDELGNLLGGFVGSITWDWLHIHVLWVSDDLKGIGYGSELLLAGENVARDRGCNYAKLLTFEFQARQFYESHGYKVISQLDGYPRGHTQFQMFKEL